MPNHDPETCHLSEPDKSLAETLEQITAAVMPPMEGVWQVVPTSEALSHWSYWLYMILQEMSASALMAGEIAAVALLPRNFIEVAFYTGYRAGLGGQDIPAPQFKRIDLEG